MFLFIFGWKPTPSVDIIAVVSFALCVFVLLNYRWVLTRTEVVVLFLLVVLCIYSVFIVIIHGAADIQIALRGLRALLNFAGGMALVRIYLTTDQQRGSELALDHLFVCFVVHAFIVIAMFLAPELRIWVYDQLDTLSYVNNTASVELGLRNSGLTYGLSQTSVLHVSGLLLIPVVLASIGRHAGGRLFIWSGAIAIIASLFLTGRSGLVVGALTVPLMFIIATHRGSSSGGGGVWSTALVLLLSVVTGVALYLLAPYLLPEQLVTALGRAEEAVSFFLNFGDTPTTQLASTMYFLPPSWHELLFGTSNLGRGSLGYVESDVGYVRLIFAIGFVGLTLALAPYVVAMIVSLRCIARSVETRVAAATLLCVAGTLLLNLKELAVLTRNQWSVQTILISLLVLLAARSARRSQSTVAGSTDRTLIAALN